MVPNINLDKEHDEKAQPELTVTAVEEPDFDQLKEDPTYPVDLFLTAEQDARIRRKVDLNLMPLLCVVYGLQFVSPLHIYGLSTTWKLTSYTTRHRSTVGQDLHIVCLDYGSTGGPRPFALPVLVVEQHLL